MRLFVCFDRGYEQGRHEFEVKMSVHRAPRICPIHQAHLMPVFAKAHMRQSQRRFAKNYPEFMSCIQTAHLPMQACIGKNDLESCDVASQQVLAELVLGTV
jgi:hypothetical protein